MKRRVSREMALQSLYQIQMTHISPQEAIDVIVEEAENDNESELLIGENEVSHEFLYELVEGTCKHKQEIDQILIEYLTGWQIDRLSRIDKEVLRLAIYEMLYRDDIPPRVVVNEAIELAKLFGTEESGKFVNGVLGKMIQDVELLKERLFENKS
jgi:N utilization substance protein B